MRLANHPYGQQIQYKSTSLLCSRLRLEQALPDAEEWLRNNLIAAVGSMIISAPGKVLKGTVNTVHSIATKSIRGAGGLVNTTGVREADDWSVSCSSVCLLPSSLSLLSLLLLLLLPLLMLLLLLLLTFVLKDMV